MARLEMARAEGIARAISDFLVNLDRSSGRDHERLVSWLINQEMALRSAERSAQWSEWGRTRLPNDGAHADLEMIRSARAAIVETIQGAGLTEDLASAQSYLGPAPARLTRAPIAIPEPIALGRIRLFGRPTTLLGILPGVDEPLSRNTLTFTSRARDGSLLEPAPERLGILAVLLLGTVLAATFLGEYRGTHPAALVLALGLAAYAGGPTMLAGGLGLAAMAWRRGRAG
jgi:hypothetical protein